MHTKLNETKNMSPQTPDHPSKLGYGELPPHPIEAKKLRETPDGWEKVQTIFDRELYEPLGASTRAEQLDEVFGTENWGIVLHVDDDNKVLSDRMFDIVTKPKEEHEASSEV
jgi:hypothetical protein